MGQTTHVKLVNHQPVLSDGVCSEGTVLCAWRVVVGVSWQAYCWERTRGNMHACLSRWMQRAADMRRMRLSEHPSHHASEPWQHACMSHACTSRWMHRAADRRRMRLQANPLSGMQVIEVNMLRDQSSTQARARQRTLTPGVRCVCIAHGKSSKCVCACVHSRPTLAPRAVCVAGDGD